LGRKLVSWSDSDIDDLNAWLSEWARTTPGRPDFTSDAIYLMPLSIAFLKSSRRLEILTTVLAILTVALVA
jgi:hypothetical protein